MPKSPSVGASAAVNGSVSIGQASQLPEILTASRFYLELSLGGSDGSDCYFLECRGFQQTQAPIEICEVTNVRGGSGQQVVRTKLPGNIKSGNITLRHGMTSSKALWDWFKSIQDGKWGEQRKESMSLTIYNLGAHLPASSCRWTLPTLSMWLDISRPSGILGRKGRNLIRV